MHRSDPVGGQVLHGGNQCNVYLFGRLLRDFDGDQIHGIVLENAGQLAACVSLYSPSGDILYLAINAGNLHCQRVGQCHVTVKARDKNRMIRGYGVNP